MKIKKEYFNQILKNYFNSCSNSFELSELTQERINYYSDRWGKTKDKRFWIIRQMINEIERRWKKEQKRRANDNNLAT